MTPVSKHDFESLLSPITRDQFFAEYWEMKPLVISRAQANYYSSLISESDLDYILSVACLLDRERVELLGPSVTLDGADLKAAAAVYQAYKKGASIRIRGVNRFWKPIWMLCLHLQELFGSPVVANLYLTPRNSHGLEKHYDRHDTMILHLAGRKHWTVHESIIELPLEHSPLLQFEKLGDATSYRGTPKVHDEVAKANRAPLHEFDMMPGDLLYLPRGFVHQARTSEESSAHMTIGIHALTWVDLITVALGQLAHKDVRFRRGLPVGFAKRAGELSLNQTVRELLKTFAENADTANAIAEITGSVIWNRQAIGEGTLAGADGGVIDSETLVERRPGMLCALTLDGETVRLTASHGDFSLPKPFERALRFVSETRDFRVRSIPGALSDPSKINLVRRLIDGGFLRVVKSEN